MQLHVRAGQVRDTTVVALGAGVISALYNEQRGHGEGRRWPLVTDGV